MCAHPTPDDSRPPAGIDRWIVSGRQQAMKAIGKEAIVLTGNTVRFIILRKVVNYAYISSSIMMRDRRI